MIVLSFPPSLNRYYRTVRGRILISAAGREYRLGVQMRAIWHRFPKFGAARLAVTIAVWQPDLRRRDLDNMLKAACDAMTHAGVYDDDSQIDDLRIWRAGVDRVNPRLEITIAACP